MLFVAPFAFLRRNEGVGDSAEGGLLGFDFRRRVARLDRIKPCRDLSPALARQFPGAGEAHATRRAESHFAALAVLLPHEKPRARAGSSHVEVQSVAV